MPILEPHSFETRLEKFDSNLWGFHIVVPLAVAEVFLAANAKRVICTLQGTETFQCALMPRGDGAWFININKKRRDALKLNIGSLLTASIVSDQSTYGLPMPEELEAVLASDEAGNRLFHALTPGKQRNILYYVGAVKDSDKRIHRALVFIDHLKANEGKINFKTLIEAFKSQ